jgi:TRAP-type C4-dicarboxylate transport system permease small subunit
MNLQKAQCSLWAIMNPVIGILLVISTGNLALMMMLIVIDVVGRYIFNMPIDGAFELTEFMMAIFVPFALVYCQKKKGHIVVDLVFGRLPAWLRRLLEKITLVLTIVYFALISWQSFFAIEEEWANSIKSSVLLISTYPFFIPLLIAFFMLTLLLLAHLLSTFTAAKQNRD